MEVEPVAEPLVRAQSSLEFFKEHVEAACARQKLFAQPLTSYYIVSLLADFTHLGTCAAAGAITSNEALGLRLARALRSAGNEQRTGLKHVGDVSLFISGFFSDSLRNSLVDIDYYMTIGGYAYGSLGATSDVLSPIFAELAEKFAAFVDVLCEVSERTSLTSDTDLLRLYEKWLRTGSRRNGDLLAEKGIVPNESLTRTAKVIH
jgi:hypothetical protein